MNTPLSLSASVLAVLSFLFNLVVVSIVIFLTFFFILLLLILIFSLFFCFEYFLLSYPILFDCNTITGRSTFGLAERKDRHSGVLRPQRGAARALPEHACPS